MLWTSHNFTEGPNWQGNSKDNAVTIFVLPALWPGYSGMRAWWLISIFGIGLMSIRRLYAVYIHLCFCPTPSVTFMHRVIITGVFIPIWEMFWGYCLSRIKCTQPEYFLLSIIHLIHMDRKLGVNSKLATPDPCWWDSKQDWPKCLTSFVVCWRNGRKTYAIRHNVVANIPRCNQIVALPATCSRPVLLDLDTQ